MCTTLWEWYQRKLLAPLTWKALRMPLAYGLGIGGQYALATSTRGAWGLGLVLYMCSAATLVLIVWNRDNPEFGTGEMKGDRPCIPVVRMPLLLSGLSLGLATYITSENNQWSPVAIVCWVGSLISVLCSFCSRSELRIAWTHATKLPKLWLNTTAVLLGAVMLMGGYFRLSELYDIPGEMTSDHVEKLLDVDRILGGDQPVFMPTNGGREPMQFYIVALAARLLGMPMSHLTLKLCAAATGIITIPLVYLLGKEIFGTRRVGLLAGILFSVGWWPVVTSRNGMRFPLAPLFATATLFLLIHGLRRGKRNSILLGGLALVFGFYGYTPFRVMPLVVVMLFAVLLVHDRGWRENAMAIRHIAMISAIVAVGIAPMMRYAVDDPEAFWHRTVTRVTEAEIRYENGAAKTFVSNAWNASRMFSWTSDAAWFVSADDQPALDWFTGGLFHIGVVMVLGRYCRSRRWLDLFVPAAIPLLILPSILALAFPIENPSITRAGMAQPIVFVVAAMALDAIIRWVEKRWIGSWNMIANIWLAAILISPIIFMNHKIVFRDYANQYASFAGNASELGAVVRSYAESVGSWESVWVVAYPHWVDTRAVGIYAGRMKWNNAVIEKPDQNLRATLADEEKELFLLSQHDEATLELLREIYPRGVIRRWKSNISHADDFMLFFAGAEG